MSECVSGVVSSRRLCADRCGSVQQEALSVVSEEQPIFEPTYTVMHMKTEMTSPGAFSQAAKSSPEAADSEWVGPVAQNHGKRAEHMNGTGWVRTGWTHRGAQIPGLSDCTYQEFPHNNKNTPIVYNESAAVWPLKSRRKFENKQTSENFLIMN